MRKVTKSLVTLGLCTTMLAGAFIPGFSET